MDEKFSIITRNSILDLRKAFRNLKIFSIKMLSNFFFSLVQQRKGDNYKFNIRHEDVHINKTTFIVFTMIIRMTQLYYELSYQYCFCH